MEMWFGEGVASPSKAHLRKALVPSVLFRDGVLGDVSRFMSTLAWSMDPGSWELIRGNRSLRKTCEGYVLSLAFPLCLSLFSNQQCLFFFFFTGFCYYDTLPPCRTTATKPADDNPETSQIMNLNTPFLPLGFPILKYFVSDAKWLIEEVKRKCEHSRRIYRGERSRQGQPEWPQDHCYTALFYNDPLDYERNRDEIKLLLMLWACAGYSLKGRLKLQWHWQVSEH